MTNDTCVACQSKNVRSGKMTAFSYSGFIPDGGSYIPMTSILGTACLDCGALILHLDKQELAKSAKVESK
jgi:hypothetical protein